MQQLPLGVQLHATAVFTSYVPGRNAAALAMVKHLVKGGAGAPLWLWGAAGSGKTHLLQSALAAWEEANGAAAYVPLALPGLQASMLAGLENCGLLALDEVDAVAGNAAMETALFHLWNGLLERGACVLLAARQPPAGVGIHLPDLASRFASSLVVQLQAPDDEELTEVLRAMADQRGLELGPGVAAFMLRRVRRDTHQLAFLMERLDAAALAAQRALTVPFVREVVGAG
jgi:DnaA family protein